MIKVDDYKSWANTLHNEGKRICFVAGNFNIIHPGHIRFLLFAKEQADVLVVGLYDKDISIGAFFSNQERASALSALSFVDEVIIIDDKVETFIGELKPDVVVKGKEFEKTENPEHMVIEQYGGKLVFSSGEKQFSSKQLLQRQNNNSRQLKEQLQRYHERYNIGADTLKTHLACFKDIKIAVIGDIIVDEYQECLAIGMSQEDPTIAVSPLESFQYLGGAGIVAGHASKLGANVDFYGVVGLDEAGTFAKEKLSNYGVDACIIEDASRPTTHKLRYRAKDKTLLRVNSFRKHALESHIIRELIERLKKNIKNYDVLLFADFSFGVLCPQLIEQVQSLCKEHQIPIVADSQTSSQVGDLTKFSNLWLTTPTEIEARLAAQDDDSGLIQVSLDLANMLGANNLIVTLGAEGILIRHRSDTSAPLDTDNLPALAESAIDTAGAGDALFVTTTLMLCAGASIWQAAFVGSVASSIQVNTRGNIPLEKDKILAKLNELTS